MIIARYVFLVGVAAFGVAVAWTIHREAWDKKGLGEDLWRLCVVMLLISAVGLVAVKLMTIQ